MAAALRLVILEWPLGARALRSRILAALEARAAEPVSPGVFRLRADREAIEGLRPLLDELRAAGGEALIADLGPGGPPLTT